MAGDGVVVVAALIERDGEFLIGQRKLDSRHGGKWEFPGGKVERGETPPEALRRELTEELAIDAAIGREVVRYNYAYPGRPPILLIFYCGSFLSGQPVNLAFEQIRWVPASAMPAYDFLEGDIDFVRRLASGEFSA